MRALVVLRVAVGATSHDPRVGFDELSPLKEAVSKGDDA
jgi:hypothetical protein